MNINVPNILLFKTGGNSFVLDIPTNRVFSVSENEAGVLRHWIKGSPLEKLSARFPKEISQIKRMQKQGLFSDKKPLGMKFGITWEQIKDNILHERALTIIELTQECNFRCKYCTFSGGFEGHRKHSSENMSEQLLEKTVDEAFKHGDRLNDVSLGFYGGEPLLKFDLIKKAVTLAHKKAKGRKLRFNMTTNAALMDKEKAKYFKDNGFSMLISLDGPREIHNRYRVFKNGEGTYEHTTRGLKILLETFGEKNFSKIGINMVVPSREWIPAAEKLWDDEPWLPRDIRAMTNIVEAPSDFIYPPGPPKENRRNLYKEWMADVEKGSKTKKEILNNIFDASYAKLHQRITFNKPREYFFPNGCCIPGVRKMFVTTDGSYYVCERAHGTPKLGSVQKGIDFQAVKKMIDDYSSFSFQDCKDCWAISLCRLCFQQGFRLGRFDIRTKRTFCDNMKETILSDLETYCNISQKHPFKLKEWEKVKIS